MRGVMNGFHAVLASNNADLPLLMVCSTFKEMQAFALPPGRMS